MKEQGNPKYYRDIYETAADNYGCVQLFWVLEMPGISLENIIPAVIRLALIHLP
jgi:hypothetical protein